MKIFFTLCFLLSLNFAHAQRNSFEFDGKFSNLQLNGQLTYRYNINKMNISLHVGYGQFGKKEYDYPQFRDGYDGVYNFMDGSGNFKVLGFKHNFSGLKTGIGFGKTFVFLKKSHLMLEMNFDYYFLQDHYTYFFSSNSTPSEGSFKSRDIDHKTASVDLTLNYYYDFTQSLALKLGVTVPFFFPSINNNELYAPRDGYLPVAGVEPYLSAGIKLILNKKAE